MSDFSKDEFLKASQKASVSSQQAELMWAELQGSMSVKARFNATNVAYYFGALIIISAMTWFMTEAWERFGGGGMLTVAVSYALLFGTLGYVFWFRRNQKIVGGLLYTIAVCMTPLGVYGFQRIIGIWPGSDPGKYRDFYVWIKGGWFFMEILTVIAGAVMLRFVRFPFLTAPIAFALWFVSMDLTPIIFGTSTFMWHEREIVSMFFGLGMLIISFLIDRRTNEDYSFWLYLFGLMAFWGGLSLMNSDSELGKFFYCLINISLILISVLLRRRAFTVFGSLGVFGYIGHLAHSLFKDSMLFPVILSLLGLAVIILGVKYEKNREKIEESFSALLPDGLKRFLPTYRQG